MCDASKGSRGDLDSCYVNLDPAASWRSSMGVESPWQMLIGFSQLMIRIDIMHSWHLGVGRVSFTDLFL